LFEPIDPWYIAVTFRKGRSSAQYVRQDLFGDRFMAPLVGFFCAL
jgi:hypothetical protein